MIFCSRASPSAPSAARIVYNSIRAARQHESIGYADGGRAIVPNGFDTAAFRPDPGAREAEITDALTGLLPFAEGRLVRVREPEPRWDHDVLLADPPAGVGWPAEIELRLPTKQPIYQLDRAAVGSLGFEGDTLLGWRGGDAIAADLA